MTTLYVEQDGQPIRQGLEVSIHWKGFFSGYSKYYTTTSGLVVIPDEDLQGRHRDADKIYVQNPKNSRNVAFNNVTIEKGKRHPLVLEVGRDT